MNTLAYLILAVIGVYGAIGGFEGHLWPDRLFQVSEHLQIVSPLPGEALMGKVSIIGSTDVLDFQSSEVSFRYEDDPGETWYLIQQSSDAVRDGTLAVWDTTTIADGSYRLRVSVILSINRTVEVVIPNLRVRNYSPVETSTPGAPVDPVQQPTEVKPSATAASIPTPTDLPDNPAQVTPVKLVFSLVQGTAFTVIFFVLLGIYLGLRAIRRRG